MALAAIGAVFATGLFSSGDVFAAMPADTGFEDEKLYEYVVGMYNSQNSANINSSVTTLTDEQLASITGTLSLKNVTSASGVEKMTGLTGVALESGSFTSIDLSKNTELTSVSLRGGAVTSVGLGNNSSLTSLDVGNNAISSLNLSGLSSLKYLCAEDNNLTSLDVSNNTALNRIAIYNNQLTSLDLSNLPEYRTSGLGAILADDILISVGLQAFQSGSSYYANPMGVDIGLGFNKNAAFNSVASSSSYTYYATPDCPLDYDAARSIFGQDNYYGSCIVITDKDSYPGYVQLQNISPMDSIGSIISLDLTKTTYKLVIVPVDGDVSGSSDSDSSSSSTIGAPKTGIFGGENNGVLATISIVVLGAGAAVLFAVRYGYIRVSRRNAVKTGDVHSDWVERMNVTRKK